MQLFNFWTCVTLGLYSGRSCCMHHRETRSAALSVQSQWPNVREAAQPFSVAAQCQLLHRGR